MEASKIGNLNIVKILVQKGANINQVDYHGVNALYLARREKHFQVEKFLLKNGAQGDDSIAWKYVEIEPVKERSVSLYHEGSLFFEEGKKSRRKICK